MTNEGERLHGEVISLRDYFERVIHDLEKRLTAAQEGAQLAISKTEEAQNRRLELLNEFRAQAADRDKTFATLTQIGNTNENLERLRDEITAIRTDHVQRREFDDISKKIDEGTGRRTAFVAAVSVIVVLFGIIFGVMQRNQLSHGDVSNQIAREAPWLSDKPQIEVRLDNLESQVQQLRVQVAALTAQEKLERRK